MAACDPLLARFDNSLARWRTNCRRKSATGHPAPVLGFDRFLPAKGAPRRALFSFPLAGLDAALATGEYRRFNPQGMGFEFARAMNELGYIVDIVDYQDREFHPPRGYDLFVGHTNLNFCRLQSELAAGTLSILYASGCAQDEFERQTRERYAAFCARHPAVAAVARPTRTIDCDELAAVRAADAIIALGELTRLTFAPHNPRTFAINNAALVPDARPGGSRGRDFVCFAGTGNVQKGVDLVIEAFAAEPTARLYLATPLEEEVLRALAPELRRSNLRYVHHHRFFPARFASIQRASAFVVLCGLNSGQSTALVGALGEGYVPVVNREANVGLGGEDSMEIGGNSIEAVRAAIRQCQSLGDDQVTAKSRAVHRHFEANFSLEAFRRQLHSTLVRITGPDSGMTFTSRAPH